MLREIYAGIPEQISGEISVEYPEEFIKQYIEECLK